MSDSPTERVGIAPGWSIDTFPIPNGLYVQLEQPGIAPDAYRHTADPTDDDPFPGGLAFDLIGPETDENLAENLIAASAVAGLHEALEWVTVDGNRLADPHPPGEDDMWQELVADMLRIVRKYRRRWPAPPPAAVE